MVINAIGITFAIITIKAKKGNEQNSIANRTSSILLLDHLLYPGRLGGRKSTS
ncbi:MAG: hypothetical protein KF816_01640 [Melioribacteraceae bacterium]|nr:hypothetical protein [Melioribacteraceae bacterium]